LITSSVIEGLAKRNFFSSLGRLDMARFPRHLSTAFFSMNGEALYLDFSVKATLEIERELKVTAKVRSFNLINNYSLFAL
ncbi:hypothetical protein, partial [Hydrocoleum sp. CS-953]|uniref:hypothetical protein n=1 Tax=Hydrocoleum sp. CS-953 TaxID=1671698 RepID=UPI001AEF62E0